MDVVVSSRHCEVSERFREHVEEKLTRLEKHDHRIIRVDVLLEKEARPREPERAVRVELTAKSKGPIVRAEASRRGQDGRARPRAGQDGRPDAPRRRPPQGPPRPAQARVAGPGDGAQRAAPRSTASDDELVAERKVGPVTVTGDGPLVVREKSHAAAPMTLEQALYEMELVGHDFYLFVDKESEKPSVVYRRRGYDYGVISLDVG